MGTGTPPASRIPAKDEKELGRGGQHHGHGTARFEAAAAQRRGNARGAREEFAVGDRANVFFFVEMDVNGSGSARARSQRISMSVSAVAGSNDERGGAPAAMRGGRSRSCVGSRRFGLCEASDIGRGAGADWASMTAATNSRTVSDSPTTASGRRTENAASRRTISSTRSRLPRPSSRSRCAPDWPLRSSSCSADALPSSSSNLRMMRMDCDSTLLAGSGDCCGCGTAEWGTRCALSCAELEAVPAEAITACATCSTSYRFIPAGRGNHIKRSVRTGVYLGRHGHENGSCHVLNGEPVSSYRCGQ
jgi:hypothetical protein